MKILLAPDSFKGTFSSAEVIEMLADGCRRHFPQAELIRIPMADGGEGTVDAFVRAQGYVPVKLTVSGPYGAPVEAVIARKGTCAVIEMAAASGIGLLRREEYDPWRTTTFGTGMLIRKALDDSADEILLGIGGSATNDGGMGMAQALGIRFLDSAGQELSGSGSALAQITRIDMSGLDPRIANCRITAICDVTNPLTGPLGASRIYSPQKGADPKLVETLEKGMCHYGSMLKSLTGTDPDTLPGSGAAGGLGAAVALLLGGQLRSGIDAVLDAVGFDNLLKDANFIITGEGRLDGQSIFGKVPCGIAKRCRNSGVKVFALAGSISGNIEAVYQTGIAGVYPVVSEPCTLDAVLENPKEKMIQAIDNMLRFLSSAIKTA